MLYKTCKASVLHTCIKHPSFLRCAIRAHKHTHTFSTKHPNRKFKVSTKSMYKTQVSRVKLSNLISKSKLINTNQMSMHLFPVMHLCASHTHTHTHTHISGPFHCLPEVSKIEKTDNSLQRNIVTADKLTTLHFMTICTFCRVLLKNRLVDYLQNIKARRTGSSKRNFSPGDSNNVPSKYKTQTSL